MRRFAVNLEFAHPLAINGKRFIHAEIFALGHEEARKDVRAIVAQFVSKVPVDETSEELGVPFVHRSWGNAVEAKR
jgi:hypothetical protein